MFCIVLGLKICHFLVNTMFFIVFHRFGPPLFIPRLRTRSTVEQVEKAAFWRVIWDGLFFALGVSTKPHS
jgi:hypothetical protein